MNKLLTTQDGSHTLESGQFGVHYHSKYGAIQESTHVFLEAGLQTAMLGRKEIDVLEIGFGTGLNALLSMLAAAKNNWTIRYTTYEAFPVSEDLSDQLNFTEVLQKPDWQSAFLQLHRSAWETRHEIVPGFHFLKHHQAFDAINQEEAFDLVYFDAFAPETQPELWNENLLGRMYRALRPGGIMTTYCAKGAVKRTLKGIGFTVEALPGPPGKREMTRVRKPI